MIYFNFSGDKREPKSVKKTKESFLFLVLLLIINLMKRFGLEFCHGLLLCLGNTGFYRYPLLNMPRPVFSHYSLGDFLERFVFASLLIESLLSTMALRQSLL